MTARQLLGVGVGPGDPELITVKAVRMLGEAGLVLVPVMAGANPAEPGRAEAIVRAHIDGARVRRIPFALSDRGGVTTRRRAAWQAAAREVAAAFAAGTATVAFATIGDPNIYSTFSYLAQAVKALVPGVAVDTVPGITAMQDLAARSHTVLAEGAESLVLLPLVGARATGSGDDTEPTGSLRQALRGYDTVVVYKFGSAGSGTAVPGAAAAGSAGHGGSASSGDSAGPVRPAGSAGGDGGSPAALLATLREAGRLEDAVYGARLGLPGEDIRPASELTPGEAVPYLATLIAPGRRSGAGSKLR